MTCGLGNFRRSKYDEPTDEPPAATSVCSSGYVDRVDAVIVNVRSQAQLENSAMDLTSARLRRSLLHAMKAGLVSTLLTSLLAIAYIVTLPEPEAGASQETRESYAEWKQSLYIPVAVVAFIEVPLIVASARFASLYPPQPLKFKCSLGLTALAAAVAHVATASVKGSPNHATGLVGAIAAVILLTSIGFRREESRELGPGNHQT